MATGGRAPGQRALVGSAPRFGLPQYMRAEFVVPQVPVLRVAGLVDRALGLDRSTLDAVPEATRELDLHCVMTWSVTGTRWTGWRFVDLWDDLLSGSALPGTRELQFFALDGAVACIQLEELLREDVMLAHSRDGVALTRAEGAPYRLVVPQLYGYQHIKHLARIELVDRHVRGPHEPWIMHHRGRVDLEERHGLGLNRAVRGLNRLFVRRALRSAGMRTPTFQ